MSLSAETNNQLDDDTVAWADELPIKQPAGADRPRWKIMIIDDDQSVHDVTLLALRNFSFEEKSLQFINAYSSAEARRLLVEHPDTAVILLDVVMEQDDSGLQLARYIREELANPYVRIILRTGQPGQAPEEQVVVDYDINDYKEKTELTARKLFTTVIASLRAYRDIMIISANRDGLQKIIDASSSIFKLQSMSKFASGVLIQLVSLLGLHKNSLYCKTSSFAATKSENDFVILAATGDFEANIEQSITSVLPPATLAELHQVFSAKQSMYYGNHFIGYHHSGTGAENLIYLEGFREINQAHKDLITIFFNNVSTAFDNLYLNAELAHNQTELLHILGEIAENRSNETGCHVKRVAQYCKLFAEKLGFDDSEAEDMYLAAAMHDIGKLTIEDQILNKPGQLSCEEFQIIQNHASAGYEILSLSSRKLLQKAAIVALQHHEKFDGTGYPCGLKGEAIHIYGRITAIADVFDALSSDRVYRKAWTSEDTLTYMRAQSGKQFDPALIKIFFDNITDFLAIRESRD